jgi:GNAT superfamily N-acetyltransferase
MDEVRVVPANEADWDEIELILGKASCHGCACYCQRFKSPPADWSATPDDVRAHRLREQTRAGARAAPSTTGLVAYVADEPAGWCNVEPRTAFTHLPPARAAWKERAEDPADPDVWSITCFFTRAGFRRAGLTAVLTRAAVGFAQARGARALEAYPMVAEPGKDITWGELHVGARSVFAAAGFREVAHPTKRRVVMRREF